jgi:hypothetical protein
MNAIEMLEIEHKGAKKLMEEIGRSTGATKKKLFDNLRHELEMHDRIEEQIFYPSVMKNPKTSGLAGIDKKAHEEVEAALARLAKLPVEDPDWNPSFHKMQDKLLEHVANEEKNYFVKVREVLSETEILQLGEKMKSEKEHLLKAV